MARYGSVDTHRDAKTSISPSRLVRGPRRSQGFT